MKLRKTRSSKYNASEYTKALETLSSGTSHVKPYNFAEMEAFRTAINTLCTRCQGSGKDHHSRFNDCPTCKGRGKVLPEIDYQRFIKTFDVFAKKYLDQVKEQEDLIKLLDMD